jgi:hypothetical protein
MNNFDLTGTVGNVRPITTKTGGAMCEVVLHVGSIKYEVVSFGNLAEYLMESAKPGTRLELKGTVKMAAWEAETDGGEKIIYQRKEKPPAENDTQGDRA